MMTIVKAKDARAVYFASVPPVTSTCLTSGRADMGDACVVAYRTGAEEIPLANTISQAVESNMADHQSVDSRIRSLHKRLSGMSTAAGLAEIDCELAATACDDFTAELMLMKAHYLIASNRKAEAIRLLTDWSERCPHCTGLHYALGEYLVEDRAYVKAVAPLSTAIALISKTGCAWYQDAAYLLRAYCHAKLGDPHKARSDLSHVEDKEGLTWIRADPVISPRSVIQLLTNLKEDN